MSRFRDTFEFMDDGRRQRERFGDNESDSVTGNDSVRSDLIDLELELRQDRPLALMVSDPKSAKAQWIGLPKSLIEYEVIGAYGISVRVSLSLALAKEKGLL